MEPRLLYIGTYTEPLPHVDGHAEGILVCGYDPETGEIVPRSVCSGVRNPSWVTAHPSKPVLYAVSEIVDFPGGAGKRDTPGRTPLPGGAVASFARDPQTGALSLLGTVVSGGSGPCHISVSRDGKYGVVANYVSGSIASYCVQNDGSLYGPVSIIRRDGRSVNEQRQTGPHAHQAVQGPRGRFVVVPDLGTDTLAFYALDPSNGMLEHTNLNVQLKPGSGPRQIAFHPNGYNAYLLNELASTVCAMSRHPDRGSPRFIQTVSLLPGDFRGESTAAAVRVHPNGRVLYASNRGHDSIACFRIRSDGKLDPLGRESSRGRTPRDIEPSPDGRYLLVANQDSDSIATFAVDAETGRLTFVRSAEAASPVCLHFV